MDIGFLPQTTQRGAIFLTITGAATVLLLSLEKVYQFFFVYSSITHNQPSENALPGTLAFSVIADPKAIPLLDQLSNTDCRLISISYGCDQSKCPPRMLKTV